MLSSSGTLTVYDEQICEDRFEELTGWHLCKGEWCAKQDAPVNFVLVHGGPVFQEDGQTYMYEVCGTDGPEIDVTAEYLLNLRMKAHYVGNGLDVDILQIFTSDMIFFLICAGELPRTDLLIQQR